jgi:hypothetical protein
VVEYTLPKVVGEVKLEVKVEVPSYVKYVPKEFKIVIDATTTTTTTTNTEKKFKGVRGGDEDGDFVKIEAKK